MMQTVMEPTDIRELAQTAARRLTKPSIETLLLDRVMFPRRIKGQGAEPPRLTGQGRYVVVVRSVVAKAGEAGDLKIQWLYVEWPRDQAEVLMANGVWTYRQSDKQGAVSISAIGLAKVNGAAPDGQKIIFSRGANVAVMSDRAVVKIRDLDERALYSILSEFNGHGRGGYSVQTGELK